MPVPFMSGSSTSVGRFSNERDGKMPLPPGNTVASVQAGRMETRSLAASPLRVEPFKSSVTELAVLLVMV